MSKSLIALPACLAAAVLFAQGPVRLKKRFSPPPVKINEENWKRLWNELAGPDPDEARSVMQNILLYPEASTPFLRKSLKPAPAAPVKAIQVLLQKLNSAKYKERAVAQEQLRKMGSVIKPALAKALNETNSPEFRRRAGLLLQQLWAKGRNPEELRAWRALNVLEFIGTKGASEHLQKLAQGAKGHWLTEEAARSLARINRRKKNITLVGKVKRMRLLKGHTSTVTSLAIDPANRLLASGSYDDTVRLWNLQTGQPLAVLKKQQSNIQVVAFSADGKTLISSDSGRNITFWDVAGRKEITSIPSGHSSYVRSLAVSPAGKYFATGSRGGVIVWDIKKRKCVATLTGHTSYVYGLAFSGDGKFLVSTGSGRIVNIWNMLTKEVHREIRLEGTYARSAALTPDRGTLLLGNGSILRLWELDANREMDQLIGHSGTVYDVALHPDGRTIISLASDRTVRLWDRFTGRELAKLDTGASTIRDLAVSANGHYLVSHGPSRDLQVWELTQKKTKHEK